MRDRWSAASVVMAVGLCLTALPTRSAAQQSSRVRLVGAGEFVVLPRDLLNVGVQAGIMVNQGEKPLLGVADMTRFLIIGGADYAVASANVVHLVGGARATQPYLTAGVGTDLADRFSTGVSLGGGVWQGGRSWPLFVEVSLRLLGSWERVTLTGGVVR